MKIDIYNEKEGTYFSIQDRKPEPFWDGCAVVLWVMLLPLILSFLLLGAVIRRLKIIDQRIFKQ